MAWTKVSAPRMARLLGELPEGMPAYQGLAARVRRLVGEGRLGRDDQLPSERDLAGTLGLSRTTVTRAYAELVRTGYAAARRGSGTVVRVPGSNSGALGRPLVAVHAVGAGRIDLTCAAPEAVPQVHAAFGWAMEQLPAQLRGSGYYPEGLPELRELIADRYARRGAPTDPDQIVVTSGALAGLAVVAAMSVSPGDRVLTETPAYPNAIETLRRAHARVVVHPVADGWDVPTLTSTLRRARPRLALLMPDFHNPTGALMDDETRERVAAALARTRTTPVVDESSAELVLDDGAALPRAFAAAGPDVVSVGGVSKSLWAGLRIGWIRAPRTLVPDLVRARATTDLGSSVVDQLAVTALLRGGDGALAERRDGLRRGRDALAAGLAARLPDWRFTLPRGGLSLWCRLPAPVGTAVVAAAERRDLLLVSGGRFSPDGGLEDQLRLPFTASPAIYPEAVRRLAEAYEEVRAGIRPGTQTGGRTPRSDRRPLIA